MLMDFDGILMDFTGILMDYDGILIDFQWIRTVLGVAGFAQIYSYLQHFQWRQWILMGFWWILMGF